MGVPYALRDLSIPFNQYIQMEFTLFTYRKVKVMNGSKLDTELNIVLEILIQNVVEHIDKSVEETNAGTHAHK